jgi:hypothetical protein
MAQQTSFYPLQGGLDLVTPAIRTDPGKAIAALNYEANERGYRRVDGHERFDGRPKPSEAQYWILAFDAGTVEIEEGDEVEGGTSGATGIALFDATLVSGTYVGTDAAGFVVLTQVDGIFIDDEDLEVSASKVAEADGTAELGGALNDTDEATYLRAGIEYARGNIEVVPGSGPVRGVWVYDGDVYAFRDNAGATAGIMHKATATGWDAQDLGDRLDFTGGGYLSAPYHAGGIRELAFTSGGTTAIFPGQTIEGATSGATGLVSQVILQAGTWTAGDAEGLILFREQTGTFQAENLDIVGGTANVATIAGDSTVIDIDPGDVVSSPDGTAIATVRAVTLDSGAWADGDAVGTLLLENATGEPFSADWIDAEGYLRVAAIQAPTTIEIQEGDTIEGDSSGETATVARVFHRSGDWAKSTAEGYLLITGQSGPFAAESLDVGTDLDIADIAGDSVANALPPGGRYRFINYNFFGASNLRRMYGVNGVGNAFEWDGDVFVPIITGMVVDKPTHVAAHSKHLFLAFPGGSLQHSGIGDPYAWSVVLGAGELGLGDDVTGLISVVGILVAFSRNSIVILYGTDASNWDLKTLADDAGAIADTVQLIGQPVYMDDQGLRSLAAAQEFGDFSVNTISRAVDPIFRRNKATNVTPIESLRVRAKTLYRLFWSNGTGLSVYFGRKEPEITTFDLGITPTCSCSSEDNDGNEIMFFGAADGMVYQLDAGTSFDGDPVEAVIRLPFNHVGSPTQRKRWHKATLEIDADPGAMLTLIPELSYGDPDQPPGTSQEFDVRAGGGFWDVGTWDAIYFDSPVEGLAETRLKGVGRNLSLGIISEATYEKSHTLHGLTLHYTYRGLKR